MAKNIYESEITLDGLLTPSDFEGIKEKILADQTPAIFFQFYLTLPRKTLKKAEVMGINPDNIEGTRLRYMVEKK